MAKKTEWGTKGGMYNKEREMVSGKPATRTRKRKTTDAMGRPNTKTTPRKRSPADLDPTKPYNKTYKKGEKNPNPPTPETRKNHGPICGAPRTGNSDSGPGICCQIAGWGTAHPGYGHCRNHGGNLPSISQKETKEQQKLQAIKARDLFGLPRDIDPQSALLEEVQRTAGHVDWLGEVIRELDDPEKLKQFTDQGVMPSVWIVMYEEERKHLVRVCSEAIKCGVAERQVRIAEEQGRLLAMVLQAFMRDPVLDLTPAQLVRAPKLIRKHLLNAPMALEELKDDETVIIDVE
jgi:hypothetical protein